MAKNNIDHAEPPSHNRSQSITKNLTVGIALTMLVISSLVVSINFYLASQHAKAHIERKANEWIDAMAKILEFPLWNFDEPTAGSIGASYALNDLITRVKIVDSLGVTYFETDKQTDAPLVIKTSAVRHEGNTVGRVEIALTTSYYQELRRQSIGSSVLLVAINLISLLVIMRFLLRRFLQKPLHDFSDLVAKYGAGHYENRLSYIPAREFQPFVAVVNEMGTQISHQMSELESARDEMEQRVRHRTAELADTNRDLAAEIVQRRQTEKSLRESQAQLQQARKMESIGTLTGGIAHDFNNILNIILGNTELALYDVGKQHAARHQLEEIQAAGLRAAGIVKQLLSFSRRTEQTLKPTDAIVVIQESIEFMRSTLPATIEIRRHITAEDTVILADPIQINQIMINLCINASHAMEQDGGVLEISVANSTLDAAAAKAFPGASPGDYLRLTISDTGEGIAPEIIDRIYDPYFTTKEVGKGSGMGLSVVHGIVKSYGGGIAVASQPGQGTVFNLIFPLIAEPPEIQDAVAARPIGGQENILFVDDEPAIADISKKILQRLGYVVEAQTDPMAALSRFEAAPDHFDLVITDMTMPGMTGAGLSQKLKALRPDVPIIISTGHSSLIDAHKAREMGIDAYVMKPMVADDIAQTIHNVLRIMPPRKSPLNMSHRPSTD